MRGEHPNPSAFPSANYVPEYAGNDPGMTLRDWFAGQALGWVADNNYPDWQLKAWFGDRGGIKQSEIQARAAYELADAMLAERAKAGAA